MGKILVLNIDRDDDFGRKAKVKTPIVGLENNLEAANKLGRADPEDSDLNAIFLAISTYDSLQKEGKDVAIATLCGDIRVGLRSDQKIAEELKQAIVETYAEEVVLVSDGAEDEYILPIIQSNIKISSIQRVSVKQSQELEDTYYRIIKMLDDDKVKKQFVLPAGLILIVWALFWVMEMASTGVGAILFTLGLYLLIRVFNLEHSLSHLGHEMKSGLLTGKLSYYTYLIALAILAASFFDAYTNTRSELYWVLPVLSFLSRIVWGIVAAGLIAAFGRVIDVYVRENKVPWQYWIVPFSLFAFGFIGSAILTSLYDSIDASFSVDPFLGFRFVGYTSAGIIIALIGAITYHYIKDLYITEEQEKEIEEQTVKALDSVP